MTERLFADEPTDADHRFYRNIRHSSVFPELRSWCEQRYCVHKSELDDDFIQRFRRETPERLSELFFAAAFAEAGWRPIHRVAGFDLAFAIPTGGRLLVEVTTPAAQSSSTWSEEKRDGFTVWSADSASHDAALRRLTSGFLAKAQLIQKMVAADRIEPKDFVVIALSGLRLSQETPVAPGAEGAVPDFTRAFLPIGPLYINFPLGELAGAPTSSGYSYSGFIDQLDKQPVDRNAFLREDFGHIDAVAYTPLRLGDVVRLTDQVGALHNPYSIRSGPPISLGLSTECSVVVEENEFGLTCKTRE